MDDRPKPTDSVETTEPEPPTEQGATRDIPWIDRLSASALVRLLRSPDCRALSIRHSAIRRRGDTTRVIAFSHNKGAPVEYMMFVATDPTAETYDPAQDNIEQWFADLTARGAHKHGDRLRPIEDATLVRVRDGEVLVTDGPFTESKEWIAGYDVIEAADLDEAIEIASKHPMARFGRIELRPVWPFEE